MLREYICFEFKVELSLKDLSFKDTDSISTQGRPSKQSCLKLGHLWPSVSSLFL